MTISNFANSVFNWKFMEIKSKPGFYNIHVNLKYDLIDSNLYIPCKLKNEQVKILVCDVYEGDAGIDKNSGEVYIFTCRNGWIKMESTNYYKC